MQNSAEASKNGLIVNNTINLASSGYFAIGVRHGSTNTKVYNNIGFGGSRSIVTDAVSSSGFASDYNLWGSNPFSNDDDSSWQTLTTWRGNGYDTHSKQSTTASVFINVAGADLHLNLTSPAIDSGTSTARPAIDIDGDPRPAGLGYDIGSDETTGVVLPTAPAAPSGLLASASSSSAITLTWTDNANNETGFKIECERKR